MHERGALVFQSAPFLCHQLAQQDRQVKPLGLHQQDQWINNGRREQISIERMILGVVHNAPQTEAEAYCMAMLTYHVPSVRRVAALSIGHSARLNRAVSDRAVRALVMRKDDPELAGTVEDALSDIAIYVYGDEKHAARLVAEHSELDPNGA